MSDIVNLNPTMRERISNLLGGKKPTPKRLEGLLDELQQLRETPEASRQPGDLPDGVEDREDAEPVSAPPVDPPGRKDARDDLIELLRNQNSMMMTTLKNMESRIEDMQRKNSIKDLADAKEAGLLPPAVAAPPLGNTGPAAWPVGQFFKSPLGPPVSKKLCACCAGGSQHHWYCVICQSGPHHYAVPCRTHNDAQRHPFYRKEWMAPGSIWGISHEACSHVCYMTYLGMIGVVAGQNDHEPLRTPVRAEPGQPTPQNQEPQRPAMAMTSD